MEQQQENTAGGDDAATLRDQQRVALRDLVALSTQCAATETQIEQKRSAALEEAAKIHKKAGWELEAQLKQVREGIEKEHAERTAAVEAKYQAERAALKEAYQAARQRSEHEQRTVERDVKQQFDHAAWLAESVFDGIDAQAREELKKAKEKVEGQVGMLEELQQKALSLLGLYGHLFPEIDRSTEGGEEITAGGAAAFVRERQAAEEQTAVLRNLQIPRSMVGFRPILLAILICLIAAGVTQLSISTTDFQPRPVVIAALAGLLVAFILLVILRLIARRQIRRTYLPLRRALNAARRACEVQLAEAKKAQQEKHDAAAQRRDEEIKAAKEKYTPVLTQAMRKRDVALASAKEEYEKRLPLIEEKHSRAGAETDDLRERKLAELTGRYDREIAAAAQRRQQRDADVQREYEEARAALERRLHEGLAQIQAPVDAGGNGAAEDWNIERWKDWVPPRQFAATVRIGELDVDLSRFADDHHKLAQRRLALPPAFSMPASLGFPRQASLLIQTDPAGRPEALQTLQMTMTRLLTSLPAGRVRLVIIDPVGLGQNFAGFMHLADHDEALVGGRIWTESEHIEQKLTNLTEHMETVIQKYLRNEYETIDQYNAQAGELAEPYRFVVIADFPANFEGESFRRLKSIASSGARCGVYTLIMRDTRLPLPADVHMDELEAHCVNLVREGDKFVWKDDVFRQFPLRLDPPPSETFLTSILDVVGKYAKEANRVEVSFDTIAPSPSQFWTLSSREELAVPVGRMGATRLQSLRLGRGVAQHVLIAGKTGSGKSTLLHAMVTNLAMWYSPDEVEFYLVDFKKGVEFKTYADHKLPHARAIAVESDREFGLSVLQRLDGELTRRGNLFRKAGVQDLSSYRQETSQKMPRTLLVIDEFQEFFSEDDKLAQDAGLLLDRLVRQGRAFGVHVLLGSQTIGGTSGLARSTIGQMAVRIALQTSEADSQMILGDNNSAARLLSRPGEAIYNDAGGLVEGNSPFQVAWLPDDRRDKYLDAVSKLAASSTIQHDPPIVFEGNAPADVTTNARLAEALEAPHPIATNTPLAWIGEPVAIKDPTALSLRRQSGANVLVIGQQEESALAILSIAMISLAAQHSSASALFHILDGTPADSPLAGVLPRIAAALPQPTTFVDYRAVPEAMAEFAEELKRRQEGDDPALPAIYILIYGLQRYRILRKQEESFSFSASDEEKKPAADKIFTDLLREGPAVGMHILTWADTPISVERTLDRAALREFDNRILFQMSASDSSNLIDSPMANKLGFHRALAFSEEQGTMEKFRPYALPGAVWLDYVKTRLHRHREEGPPRMHTNAHE